MFKRSLLATGLATGLLAGVAAPALASAPLAVTVPSAMPLAAVGISEVACHTAPAVAAPAYTPVAAPAVHPLLGRTSARFAKSAAIMGGQMSALDRMRMEQAGIAAPAAAPAAAAPAALSAANSTACALIGARPAVGIVTPAALPTALPTAGRFFGTERVRIGRTRFDGAWQRVSGRKLSRRDLARSLGAVPQDRDTLLGTVNRWVNHEIRYRDDRVQFGTPDYWADARMTLRNRSGDCEDYAILKMQMLAAAGVAREDMMLTLARDTIQRSDHAVLLVKHEGSWVMLDMASDRIAPAAADYGYRPVMSFAAGERYIHGMQVSPAPQRIRVAYAY